MDQEYIVPAGQGELLGNLGIAVSRVGAFFDTERHFVRRDGIPEWILLYCAGGEGFVVQEGARTRVPPRWAALIPADCAHTYGSRPEDPWKLYWVHFLWRRERLSLPVLENGMGIRLISPAEPEKIQRLLTEILRTLSGGQESWRHMAAGAYLVSVLSQMSMREDGGRPAYSPYVYTAEQILRKSLNAEISLDQLAEQVGISKYHLIRCFKENVGASPMHYLMELRLQDACRMLAVEGLSVDEVGERLQFCSAKYFSSAFQKKMGVSPSKYRQVYREFQNGEE